MNSNPIVDNLISWVPERSRAAIGLAYTKGWNTILHLSGLEFLYNHNKADIEAAVACFSLAAAQKNPDSAKELCQIFERELSNAGPQSPEVHAFRLLKRWVEYEGYFKEPKDSGIKLKPSSADLSKEIGMIAGAILTRFIELQKATDEELYRYMDPASVNPLGFIPCVGDSEVKGVPRPRYGRSADGPVRLGFL